MTYIAASREALERALRSCRVEDGSPAPLFREGDIGHIAHQIIASGAVVAADSLADDEALVERVTRKFCEPALEESAYADFTRDYLRALAAALTERAQ